MMRGLILAMLVLVSPLTALGIDLEFIGASDASRPGVIRISGEIKKGDHKILLRILTPGSPAAFVGYTGVYELDSPGGSIEEAMLMADVLKDIYPIVSVKGICASSCVLLYLAGAIRSVDVQGRVGVHRPYFDKQYFASLPASKAQKEYGELEDKFRAYLVMQGLPQSIIEKLMATSSKNIYWLNDQELGLIGWAPPYFDELIFAKCAPYIEQNLISLKFTDFEAGMKCYAELRGELIKPNLNKLRQRLLKEKMPTKYCPIEGAFRPC